MASSFVVRGAQALGVSALLALAGANAARAVTIYDSTGGAPAMSASDPLSATGAGPVLADRFVSPSNLGVTSVTLDIGLNGAAPAGAFLVEVFADTGTGPGAAIGLVSVGSDATLSPGFSLQTFTAAAPIALSTGFSYYVGVLDAGSAGSLANTTDPAVLGRPDVTLGAFYFNNGGVQANAGGPYELTVDAIPEPAAATLLLGGLAALGFVRRRA